MAEKKTTSFEASSLAAQTKGRKGFTLIELLVVLSVISVLMGILLPVAAAVRRRALTIKCMQNMREITRCAELFAMDNDGRYPESVATIGFGNFCHWDEPTMLIGYMMRAPGVHRAMSEYLGRYITDASIMVCPCAPHKHKYLQQAWEAGDSWDNPDTPSHPDALLGTYCFYWNYIGFLGEEEDVFKGPLGPSYGRGRSKLLITDYFGYGHWRSPGCYGSSERFKRSTITEGSDISSAYWSISGAGRTLGPSALKILLHAGYTDGHVENYTPANVAPMWVSLNCDGTVPNSVPGIFYLPENALH